jgi:hypothetical protein
MGIEELEPLSSLTKDDLKTIFEQAEKEIKDYNKDLETRAKDKKDLFTHVDMTVRYATMRSFSHRHTPQSEMRCGGTSPVYSTGMSTRLELMVDSNCEINKVTFNGYAPLEKGDTIRVYFLKGEQEYFKSPFSSRRRSSNQNNKHVWIERDFLPEEKALKIDKLRAEEPIATYIPSS